MLTLFVSASQNEFFDPVTKEFVSAPDTVLHLEHSLSSLSKWESKFEKPFLSKEPKSREETLEYIKCMVLDENVDPKVFMSFSAQNYDEINKYINAKMTATTFHGELDSPSRRETITAEIIEHWMINGNIPFECRHWHLNRLLTLIKVVSIKNAPPKKMSRADAAAQQRKLNAARQAALKTSG